MGQQNLLLEDRLSVRLAPRVQKHLQEMVIQLKMLCSLRELSKTPSSFYGSVTSAVCIVAHKAFTNHVHLSWSAAIVHTSVKSGYSVSWIWWICSASCNNTVLRERVISLQPNPQLGAPGHNTLPGPYPSVLCSAWVSLPGVQNSSRPSSRGHGEANRPTTMRWWSFQDDIIYKDIICLFLNIATGKARKRCFIQCTCWTLVP